MPPYPLPNFEIQKYYQKKPKFKDIYLRNNLPTIQDQALGTLWIALYVNGDNVTYFTSFGVEYIPKEI